MGLLDWFRRHGASSPGRADVDFGGADEPEEYRGHGPGVPAGSAAEGPPVGVSDPGLLTGDDADEVVAADEGEDPSPTSDRGPAA